MSLQDKIREHLEITGLSMRALSMEAGLYPKAVATILNRPGHRPGRKILDALGRAMNVELPDTEPRTTYAQLITRLGIATGDRDVDSRNRRLRSRVNTVLRAAEWVPETEEVDRRRAVELFAGWSAATLGLAPRSFHSYKSDFMTAIDLACGGNRKQSIRDVSGLHRDIYEAIQSSTLPEDLKLNAGAFFFFLDRERLLPSQVDTHVLLQYFHYRCDDTAKTEAVCRKHVKRIAGLCCRLALEPAFAEYGFHCVDHPFGDQRDKYDVPVSTLEGFLREFDGPFTRWVMGMESREGLSHADFVAHLDREDAEKKVTGKLALLKPRKGGKKKTEAERKSAGFLVEDETWSEATLANRRGILVAGAKALFASTGYLIESVEEYSDPTVVEAVLEAVTAANSSKEFPSSYASTMGKAIKKMARDYVGRPDTEIDDIASLISDYSTGSKGIAERNKAKLRKIVGEKEQRLLDLGEILTDEVNARLDRSVRQHPGMKRLDCLDVEMARDMMCVVASDILLARAPRKANATGIKLSWISWREGLATITVPNIEVKMRDGSDPDLPIPLGGNESRRLRLYIDKVRCRVLREGDDRNPYLFPFQAITGAPGQAYSGLPERLMRHTKRVVGIRMNPHLYRHFLGWLWLREDPNRLPDVQRLLGHKTLETTLEFYAEIDETLALERWQKHLTKRKIRGTRS
ncbi:tyrosine-type recombinase/integrase [Arenibacterium halophilum]|uniref:Tyr recombinase domain-containing protein n=1 Tax=Arenibacterium halophilum TaxID=2583821 RepID=A0ABY2XC37_9RHOB|nr:tyrosine-type recombinase/integrase [Arenibacterium halophilum]TMV14588.1 hypothetical protein FGK64_00950 [Arenibacterium halophilum]